MKEYMGVVEALGGGQISSDWLPSVQAVMEWGKSLGHTSGLIFERDKTS